jgi:hypothetical protein
MSFQKLTIVFMPFLQLCQGTIAHNVPAVYDGLTARIRALRSKDQGCKNVAEQGCRLRGNQKVGMSDRRSARSAMA